MRIAALFALPLTACVSMQGIQQHEPDAVYSSAKPIEALEECIALGLSPIAVPSVIRGPGRVIMAFGSPNPGMTATIETVGATSSVTLRSAIGLNRKWKGRVQACL